MNRTDAAALAASKPPSCIAGFRHDLLPLEEDGLELAAEFALKCLPCGHDEFYVTGYPSPSAPDAESPDEDGETFNPPHNLQCGACKHTALLFDPRKHGYDAILNDFSGYETGENGEQPTSDRYRITASFVYNIELEELAALAAEANVPAPDLFDFITILGTSADGEEHIELSYECA